MKPRSTSKLRRYPPHLRPDALMQWLASLYAAPGWERMAIGVIAAACGALWRYAAMDILGERVAYLTFYPVVAVAALSGGLISGASATVAAALSAHLWFIPLSAPGDWLGLAMFLVSCGIVSGMTELLHRTWIRMADSEALRADAERLYLMRNERLTAMSGMAIAVAHELNQPLSATTMYLKAAKRLLRLPESERPARVDDALDQAAEQILRAGQIISHMRQFVGRGEPDKTFCSCHGMIRQASDLVREAMKDANVAVDLALNAANDRVLADSVQITQVLVNLMRNAREAMSASPRRSLTVTTSNELGFIRIDIADTGPGLTKAMEDKLFEPFASSKPSGMGVGLSISRSIVEAHYGRIWAESEPGSGTVFHFSLPLAE